jgi:hypothetical protein
MSRILFLFVAIFLSGCSSIQIVYNNADWLIRSDLQELLDVEGPAEKRLRSALADYLALHRREILPLYAYYLRSIALDLQKPSPLSEVAVRGHIEEALNLYDRTVEPMIAPTVQFLLSLSDLELNRFQENLAKDHLKKVNQKPRDQADRFQSRLEFFTGSLTEPQEQLVKAYVSPWGDERRKAWLEFRESQQAKLISQLKARAPESDISAWMRVWAIQPSEHRGTQYKIELLQQRNELVKFLTVFLASLTSAQKTKAVNRLLNLSQDFVELSQES